MFNHQGERITWEPYSQKNLSDYKKLWEELYDFTIEELKQSQKNGNFNQFYDSVTKMNLSIRLPLHEIKKDFSEYLRNNLRYDDSQIQNALDNLESDFKKIIIQKLEEKIGVKLDDHVKKVLAQYYASSHSLPDWDNTIYIIELIKSVIPPQSK